MRPLLLLVALAAGCGREERAPVAPPPAPSAPAAPRSAAPPPTEPPSAAPPAPKAPCRCLYHHDPTLAKMRVCEPDEPDHRGSTECIGPNR